MSALTRSRWQVSSHRRREAVYLLHGFAGNRLLMHRMARNLQRAGYEVRNWSYPSVRSAIAVHAAALRDDVELAVELGHHRIHFVAHSLGSIVLRRALCENPPPVVGRIVMLAPPNSGSAWARAGAIFLGKFCPVLHELSTIPSSYVNRLRSPEGIEIGVIAGSHDWVVRRKDTILRCRHDHIVVRGDHLRLPLLRAAIDQTLNFLRAGGFRRQKNDAKCADLGIR
jgi:pimeloyl-ACP methyl ester carboxylesterase